MKPKLTSARLGNALLGEATNTHPESGIGKASDYIHHFEALARAAREIRVVLYCRVSERYQQYRKNQNDQVSFCRAAAEGRGAIIVGVVAVWESGWRLDPNDRLFLEATVQKARNLGAIVLAESTSRFIRSANYDNEHQDALPTNHEFRKLMDIAGDVKLATILHPEAPDERSYQTKRGQQAKGRKGGRPSRKHSEWLKKIRPMAVSGVMTVRDLVRGRVFPNASAAKQALDELAEVGLGVWLPNKRSPRGGRPESRFKVSRARQRRPKPV